MFNKLEWDASLAVGVDTIDIQHRDIIDRINALRKALSEGQGGAEAAKMVAFLEEFVVSHFGMEEVLMRRKKYDGYLAHRQEHLNFITEYTVKKKKFEELWAEGALLSFFAVELERWLSRWLTDHIAKMDRALGEFLMRPQSRPEGIAGA